MNTFDSFFKIIVVHEDSIAGHQATGLLTRLAAEWRNHLGMDINPEEVCNHVWPFEWLQHHEPWKQAVAEAADADMIVVACSGDTELPAFLQLWLERALARKEGAPLALVALLDQQQKITAAALPPEGLLRRLAKDSSADFFCNQDFRPPRVESAPQPVRSSIEGESDFSDDGGLAFTEYSGWGLND